MSSMSDILGSNPVVNALARRGVNSSVLMNNDQPLEQNITPMDAGFDPNMAAGSPYPPLPTPDKSPMSMMQKPMGGGNPFAQSYATPQPSASVGAGAAMGGGEPMADPTTAGAAMLANPSGMAQPEVKDEAQLIVEALLTRLKHLSKIEQTANEPAPALTTPEPEAQPTVM